MRFIGCFVFLIVFLLRRPPPSCSSKNDLTIASPALLEASLRTPDTASLK